MRSILALVATLAMTAAACGVEGEPATQPTPGSTVATTSPVTDPVPASDADLVLVHRVGGECPMGICRETLVWSDGYFRTSPYDLPAGEGQVASSTVGAVIDAVATGRLKEEPAASAGCQPEVDDLPDRFLVVVSTEEAARPLSWCRHAVSDLPPAWDTLGFLVDEIDGAVTQPAAEIVLEVSITGGCQLTRSCTVTAMDEAGRRWAQVPLPIEDVLLFEENEVALRSSLVDTDELELLVGLVADTDFDALRASLGEGVCNGCVDGIDYTFDFVSAGEVLDSVTYDLSPSNHPLFEVMWTMAE